MRGLQWRRRPAGNLPEFNDRSTGGRGKPRLLDQTKRGLHFSGLRQKGPPPPESSLLPTGSSNYSCYLARDHILSDLAWITRIYPKSLSTLHAVSRTTLSSSASWRQ